MGICSDDDFELEREKLNGHPNKAQNDKSAEVLDQNKGRGNKLEVPKEIRETVAKAAINGEGTGAEIANAFGVSESSVSAYKQGAHSTSSYNEPNQNLLDVITDHKQKISNRARKTLMTALKEITAEKLATVKVKDLASIAKDMSAIVADMEPKVSPTSFANNNQGNVQFVFMAPRVRDANEYPVIEVRD